MGIDLALVLLALFCEVTTCDRGILLDKIDRAAVLIFIDESQMFSCYSN